jgi:hypothetical protein
VGLWKFGSRVGKRTTPGQVAGEEVPVEDLVVVDKPPEETKELGARGCGDIVLDVAT